MIYGQVLFYLVLLFMAILCILIIHFAYFITYIFQKLPVGRYNICLQPDHECHKPKHHERTGQYQRLYMASACAQPRPIRKGMAAKIVKNRIGLYIIKALKMVSMDFFT